MESENNYKVWADLLMANLHAIAPGSAIVTLANFYQENHPMEIKLKPTLNAQKNAAIFYKKGKNQQIEIDHLQKLVDNKKQECDTLITLLQQIEKAQDKKELRNTVGTPDSETTAKKKCLHYPTGR